MNKKCILQTLSLLFFIVTATAQQGINYKAIINDGSGDALLTQPVTIQFTILENGTTEVYKESHTPTTDVNGIIIVNIGEGTVISGDFDDIDWGSNPHYLNTQINTGSVLTDMGTAEFKAVPYALFSKTTNDADLKDDIHDLKSRIEYLENIVGVSLPGNDEDGDGYTENEGDCDDTDAAIYPGATEICDDAIDQNCDGIDCTNGGCTRDIFLAQNYFYSWQLKIELIEIWLNLDPGDLAGGIVEFKIKDFTEGLFFDSPELPCHDILVQSNSILMDFPRFFSPCQDDFFSDIGYYVYNISVPYLTFECFHDNYPDEYSDYIEIVVGEVDYDEDGYIRGLDCDDLDPAIHPGATEIQDGIDNDCDGEIDENINN